MSDTFIHPSAVVEENVTIDSGAKVWHFCHVRRNAKIEEGVTLGKDVYVDQDVRIGAYSRIQNGVSIYRGIEVSPWCFIGPHVIFTNDQSPRAGNKNWVVVPTTLKPGSSIGAGAIIRCGVVLGSFCMVGAGAVVTRDVPQFHLAVGIPAKIEKMICACGATQFNLGTDEKEMISDCCKLNLDTRALEIAKKCIG